MNRLMISIPVLPTLLVAAGCAVHKATISSYVDPTYEPREVERIAVFPIRNARAAPSEAQMMNRRLSQEVARLLQQHYPPDLRDQGVSGRTQVFIEIRPSGDPGRVVVATPSEHPELDHAVLAVARGMRFQPARKGGKPVAIWVTYWVRFAIM